MGERASPLQKLPHVIPAAIPVASDAPVSTINSHSGRHNQLKLYFSVLNYTYAKLYLPNIYDNSHSCSNCCTNISGV